MRVPLQGVKVLVVEDEYLVASLMQEMLASAGCIVAGPIPRLAQALDAASTETYDVVQESGEKIEFGEARQILLSRPNGLRVDLERRDGSRQQKRQKKNHAEFFRTTDFQLHEGTARARQFFDADSGAGRGNPAGTGR